MEQIALTAPVAQLPQIGQSRAQLFVKLGIRRLSDLLFFFPRDYVPPAPVQSYDQITEGQRIAVVGVVDIVEARYSQNGRSVVGALLKLEGGGFMRLTWFNQAFRASQIARGDRLRATGIAKSTGVSYQIVHPELLKLQPDEEVGSDSPRPIYPLTEGLNQRQLTSAIAAAVEMHAATIPDVFPAALLREYELLPIETAIRQIHSPETMTQAAAARHRFIFQELYVYQAALAIRRRRLQAGAAAPAIPSNSLIHHRILNRIGLRLTGDQEVAIAEITADMARTVPMNRLLQGDVGSGKTAVALYAMLLAVAGGHQATFMAPTEVLARQHFERLQRQLDGANCEAALLVGSLPAGEKSDVQNRIALGTVDLVVGTQALLSRQVEFVRLGLAVIDEQHKFGVAQRASLRGGQYQPHYLVLSATPIPRTLTMTAFGDLDVSVLREKPPGRQPVHTYIAAAEEQPRWWDFVRKRLDEGRQAFVIVPRVLGDGEEVAGAEETFHVLANGELSQYRVALLHGRMEAEEKNATLARFDSGQIDVLVATTVVEVGIDVPNASTMTIIDANRLGLAQLHQLRGRVGRGKFTGYVCVFPSIQVDGSEHEKLQAFKHCDDGFELAEMDVKLRGPGNLLGTQQSGLPPFRIADLVRDAAIVESARHAASRLIDTDPELLDPHLARLKQQIESKHGEMIELGDVG